MKWEEIDGMHERHKRPFMCQCVGCGVNTATYVSKTRFRLPDGQVVFSFEVACSEECIGMSYALERRPHQLGLLKGPWRKRT